MWVRVEVWDEGPILNTFPKNLEDEWNLKKQIRKKKKKGKKQIRKSREGTCGRENTKAWFEKNHGNVWKIMD